MEENNHKIIIMPASRGEILATPVSDDVDDDTKNSFSVIFTPIIAWKIIYNTGTMTNEGCIDNYALPILADGLYADDDWGIYYPDQDVWNIPFRVCGEGKENLVEYLKKQAKDRHENKN